MICCRTRELSPSPWWRSGTWRRRSRESTWQHGWCITRVPKTTSIRRRTGAARPARPGARACRRVECPTLLPTRGPSLEPKVFVPVFVDTFGISILYSCTSLQRFCVNHTAAQPRTETSRAVLRSMTISIGQTDDENGFTDAVTEGHTRTIIDSQTGR